MADLLRLNRGGASIMYPEKKEMNKQKLIPLHLQPIPHTMHCR